jgi:chloramphenicol-sensitive protein RarD
VINGGEFHPDRKRGFVSGAGAYVMWGLFPLYFRRTPPTSAVEILFWRMVLTLAAVGVFLAIRGQLGELRRLRREPLLARRVVMAALLIASNWGVYIWAIANDHVVESALGYYINPLVTVSIGVIVLKEHLHRVQQVAVALGAVAVAVLTIDYGRPPLIALWLAFTFAAYSFLKKKIDLPAVVSLAGETLVLAPVGLIGLAIMGGRGTLDIAQHGAGHLVLVLFAGVVTAVPLSLFAVAARNLPLTMIGLMQYLTPTMVLLLGVVVFHEPVPATRWIGIVLVWTALVALAFHALTAGRAETPSVHPESAGRTT